jgi:hypothetical protein
MEHLVQAQLMAAATNNGSLASAPSSSSTVVASGPPVQPLHLLYSILHSFCQSLQLEVLHSQTHKLCYERLGDSVRVEEYRPGLCLTVSYWRQLAAKDPFSEMGYRLSVQVRKRARRTYEAIVKCDIISF